MDARSVHTGSTIDTDLAIVGGGPAGISLALALASAPIRVLLLESGGSHFEPATQSLYAGEETGVSYIPLENTRLRYLGGCSNHWGGWCRPLDPVDFEPRATLAHSGWPFGRAEIEPYFARAQSLVEAGPFIYDETGKWANALGAPIHLAPGGVYTTFFQFSKQRGSILPTHFGERYGEDLRRIGNLQALLHANVTGLRLSTDAARLDHLDVATLAGNRFKVKPKFVVLAAGGIETPRLLLASNDVMTAGVGNAQDLVGRFFADHPIPGQTATLVLFDGHVAPYYQLPQAANGAYFRAAFAPRDDFRRAHGVPGALATVEGEVQLDGVGLAALAETAGALGMDASSMRAFTLGCGMELAPDPDRRVTLTSRKDALGMPRLKLDMRVSDDDFAQYRNTLKELGRQLLAARTGMIRLLHTSRAEWLAGMDWGNHHMGTTRMSIDPRRGVVDANSKVHGVGNLYVAGSSVFPTYGASNPTLNLIALVLRLADHLKRQFR
ncbi:MAG TPA: GMC family oxidoreductase [Rhizomicrobium sp.]|jgi:choline dehydrogenase-like flavoprotein|nr:GMC family oxidoreductase [Rhizomicrobium sp.]